MRSTHARSIGNDISVRDALVLVGCFSSSKPLTNQGTYKYQSSGYCSGICTSRNQGVVGLSDGDTCWCGDELPAADTKVLDARCNTPCQGYGIEDCGGGTYYFTVWLTGLQDNVPNYDPKVTSTTSSSTTQATSTSRTSTATNEPESTSTSTPAKSDHGLSDKSVAIIIGVVLGLVAFIVMAIVFCCLWRRKKRTGTLRRKPSTLLAFGSRPSSWASLAPDATISILAGSRKWEGRLSATPCRSLQPVIATTASQHSSMSERNPFFTPQERQSIERQSSTYSRQDEGDRGPFPPGAEVEGDSLQQRQMPMSERHGYSRDSPLPVALRLGNPSRVDMLSRYQPNVPMNPSPPDEEAADVVSPITTSTKRNTQPFPMVHYPSWSEVSDFDFAAESGGGNSFERKPVPGWHPWRERKDGRYELA